MKSVLCTCLILVSHFAFSANAKIEADKLSGCSPLQINFSGNSEVKEGTTYNWDFGNGSKSDHKAPSVVFIEPGTYKVKLLVKNDATIEESTVDVTVFASPKADFETDKRKACADDVITFINKSSSANKIVNYVWGFGDGKTVTGNNIITTNHSYKNSSQYDVSLLVTDEHGCMGSKIGYSMIESVSKPVADFKPSLLSSCNETQDISFANQSTGGNLKFSWNFGDKNTSSEVNPSHPFNQGKYNVALSVKDENGCLSTATKQVSITKLKADFIAEKELACTGEKLKFVNTSNFKGTKWSWDFGDGTTSAESNPQKTFSKVGTYSIKFTVVDGECTQTVAKNAYVSVRNGINTTFTSDISSSCNQPVSVKLKNNTPNSALVLWNFGDGTVSTKPNPEKVYASAGNYKVSLEVTDSSGCTATKEADKVIHAFKPMARFMADTFACAGYQVKFTNFTPNAASYLWTFGDGETSTQKNPFHVYKKNGRYDISLTAHGDGCDSTVIIKQYVNIDTLKVDFEIASVQSFVPPFLCTFVNKTNNASLKYMWDFGDGNTEKAMASTTAHIYNTPGNYNIRLIGYSKSGCTNAKTIPYNFQVGTSLLGD